MANTNIDTLWDNRIKEFEIDSSWKDHPMFQTKEYIEYREKWNMATQGKLVADFPLNIELEPTYYCNLKCPACPRYTSDLLTRDSKHMKDERERCRCAHFSGLCFLTGVLRSKTFSSDVGSINPNLELSPLPAGVEAAAAPPASSSVAASFTSSIVSIRSQGCKEK